MKTKPFDYVVSDRPEVANLLPVSYKTVLEIGCAKGGFKESLRGDAEIWGIEPNAAAADVAQARGYRMLVGTYDDVASQIPDHYFDLLVCNDVIEHMPDHDAFLVRVKQKLKPGAVLVGSIPNVRYFGNIYKLLVHKDWQYTDQGILDRTHLRFFTEKSIRSTLLNNNYAILCMAGINSDFSRPVSLRQLLKNALLLGVIVLTLGYCKDFQYMQYAFSLKVKQ